MDVVFLTVRITPSPGDVDDAQLTVPRLVGEQAVAAGRVPGAQRGREHASLAAWERLLRGSRGAEPGSTALERIDAPPGIPDPGRRR